MNQDPGPEFNLVFSNPYTVKMYKYTKNFFYNNKKKISISEDLPPRNVYTENSTFLYCIIVTARMSWRADNKRHSIV